MGYDTYFTGKFVLDRPLTAQHRAILQEFAREEHSPGEDGKPSSPSNQVHCQWVPTDDGAALVWDGREKFYDYVEWIEYLIATFLAPWRYVLNGEVRWHGEGQEGDDGEYYADTGVIIVRNNHVNAESDPGCQRLA